MSAAETIDAAGELTAWQGLTSDEAAARLDVDPRSGLDAAEVERRRTQYGPNKLAEAEKEPGWQAFLRQYRDFMQIVLLGAAVVSIVALQEFTTGIVLIGLTVFNAVIGLHQEGKAEESVAALQKMMMIKARVRRDGAAGRDRRRGAGARATSSLRGRRQGPGRRPAARRRDARDRGGGADRREHAGAEVDRRRSPGDDVPLGDRLAWRT